jgi:hypothetical protein
LSDDFKLMSTAVDEKSFRYDEAMLIVNKETKAVLAHFKNWIIFVGLFELFNK